mmetsp:Transcript_12184/g.29550  ORF Transcript_12184/g.29550 Transcript_12184/m.29550 type:complete len:211 (-) Transcript_12184:1520-2152(-)
MDSLRASSTPSQWTSTSLSVDSASVTSCFISLLRCSWWSCSSSTCFLHCAIRCLAKRGSTLNCCSRSWTSIFVRSRSFSRSSRLCFSSSVWISFASTAASAIDMRLLARLLESVWPSFCFASAASIILWAIDEIAACCVADFASIFAFFSSAFPDSLEPSRSPAVVPSSRCLRLRLRGDSCATSSPFLVSYACRAASLASARTVSTVFLP